MNNVIIANARRSSTRKQQEGHTTSCAILKLDRFLLATVLCAVFKP